MNMLLSFLIACGGDTAENTEVVNTTATVTEDGIEVVETTTTDETTTNEVTTETTTGTTTTTTGTTTTTTETTENTETTNGNQQFIGLAAPSKSRFSFMEEL